MSLKVYNGFRMKALNLKEQKEFLDEVKERLMEVFTKRYCKLLSARLINFIDKLTVLDYNKNFEELDVNLKLYYRHQFHNTTVLKEARSCSLIDINEKEMLNRLGLSYYSLYDFVVDILDQEMAFAEVSQDIITIEADFKAELALFPISDIKTLFIAYSNEFTVFMRELLKDDSFCKKYELEEYCFFGSGDKPDEICEEDWNQRYNDWSEAFKDSGDIALSGIIVSIMDADTFKSYLLKKHALSSSFTILKDEIISNFPSLEKRIEKRTNDITFQKYWERYLADNGLDEKGYKLSLVNGVYQDYLEKIDEKDEIVLNLVSEVKDNLCKILTEIDENKIYKGSVLDWLPNYKTWISNNKRLCS